MHRKVWGYGCLWQGRSSRPAVFALLWYVPVRQAKSRDQTAQPSEVASFTRPDILTFRIAQPGEHSTYSNLRTYDATRLHKANHHFNEMFQTECHQQESTTPTTPSILQFLHPSSLFIDRQ